MRICYTFADMWMLISFLMALNGGGSNVAGSSSLKMSTLTLAEIGFEHYREDARLTSDTVVIIDYSKPSTEKRLYVVDLGRDSVLMETYVSHGRNSGGLNVTSFSNQVNSNQSSQGFFRISEEYVGKHGESYRLDGLEKGINDNARKRAVVIHSAWYVSEQIIAEQGRLGRSFGCPAVSLNVYEEFQKLVRPNSLLFIYHPNEKYFNASEVFTGISWP